VTRELCDTCGHSITRHAGYHEGACTVCLDSFVSTGSPSPPCSAFVKAPHPWSAFLRARAKALVWLRDEMRETAEESARTMSMDPKQIVLILMDADAAIMRAEDDEKKSR